jgi:hypothetical protein
MDSTLADKIHRSRYQTESFSLSVKDWNIAELTTCLSSWHGESFTIQPDVNQSTSIKLMKLSGPAI